MARRQTSWQSQVREIQNKGSFTAHNMEEGKKIPLCLMLYMPPGNVINSTFLQKSLQIGQRICFFAYVHLFCTSRLTHLWHLAKKLFSA